MACAEDFVKLNMLESSFSHDITKHKQNMAINRMQLAQDNTKKIRHDVQYRK